MEVPGGHLDHPAILESPCDGSLDLGRCEAVLGGQEAEAGGRQPELAHPEEEVRVCGGISAPPAGLGSRQGPDGRRQDMPPAVPGAAHQPLGEAAAAGRGPLPDDAGQGAFFLALKIGQGQQPDGSAEAATQEDDPAARDAAGLQVMDDLEDIPGFRDPEGHRGNLSPLPDGIVPPPVGEDGRIQIREPLQGRTGAPAVIAETVEEEHHARGRRPAGEPPELETPDLLTGPGPSRIPILALRQFPVGGLHPGQGLGVVEGRVDQFTRHRTGFPPDESTQTQQGRQPKGQPGRGPHQ